MRKTRKATWLLTVASAYSVLPACSDDPATDQADASTATYDSSVTTTAPRKDAAAADASRVVIDTSSAGEVIDTADDVDITTLIGVILFPPDEGDLPQMDAGSTDTPSDASLANDASDVMPPVDVAVSPLDGGFDEGDLTGITVVPPRT